MEKDQEMAEYWGSHPSETTTSEGEESESYGFDDNFGLLTTCDKPESDSGDDADAKSKLRDSDSNAPATHIDTATREPESVDEGPIPDLRSEPMLRRYTDNEILFMRRNLSIELAYPGHRHQDTPEIYRPRYQDIYHTLPFKPTLEAHPNRSILLSILRLATSEQQALPLIFNPKELLDPTTLDAFRT